ncbi:Hsp70 family protein [Pseudonocardia sp. KRD-291]|nr:Hsp70 family protein [Pseudonocardia sp. KRD291]
MGYLLGIDVGTTRTAAAISRSESPGTPEMITLGDHSVDVPSVVFLSGDGSVLVGEAAERRGVGEPDRVAREFKRRLGDPTPVSLGGRPFTAQELSVLLVRHVVDLVVRREGAPPDRIAVTHPASWGAHKKELLGSALAAAGLTVTFLAEPQAAALRYAGAERVEPGSTIAVYDLGGGTFDAAVVRKDAVPGVGVGFTLLGRPEGVEFLGGVDFDQVVFDHVRAAVPEAFAGLDESDPQVWAAVARLRRDCCEAKEALSADTEVTIPVWLGGTQLSVRLHRGEFEDLIRPALEETVAALRRAVGSAGLEPAGLSSVLLVGGSSRIPLVAQMVSEQLGRPVSVDADPKNAIAQGAALALAEPAGPAVGAASSSGPWPSGAATGVVGAGAAAGVAGAAGAPVDEPVTDRMSAGAAAEPGTEYLDPAHAGTEYLPHGYDPQDPPTEQLPVLGAAGYGGAGYGAGGYAGDGYGDAGYGGAGYAGDTALSPEPAAQAGRSPALLIGAGGVVAAVAVIGAVLFWPNDQTVSNATPELPALPTTAAPAPPPAAATTTEQAPVTTEQPERTRERPSDVTSTPQAPPPPVVPPPVGPTPPPKPPESSTSTPTTTSSSAPPSSESSSPAPPAGGQPQRR